MISGLDSVPRGRRSALDSGSGASNSSCGDVICEVRWGDVASGEKFGDDSSARIDDSLINAALDAPGGGTSSRGVGIEGSLISAILNDLDIGGSTIDAGAPG
jgi:hypothetical protein